jgi:hypothetical protein
MITDLILYFNTIYDLHNITFTLSFFTIHHHIIIYKKILLLYFTNQLFVSFNKLNICK